MKRWTVSAVLCGVVFATVLLALPGETLAAAPRIGVLLKNRGSVWGKVEEGIVDAGKALGVEIVLKQVPSGAQPALQLVLLNALLKENLDALILAPIDSERLEAPLRPFVQKGLKIVAIDTPLPGDLSKVFVTHNQDMMSEKAAQLAAERLTDGDEMALLRFQQIDRTVLDRERKIMDALKTRLPNLKIRSDIFASTGLSSTDEQVKTLLGKYPNVKLVVTSTYGATRGMMRALRDKNLGEKISLVGFGIYLPDEVAAAIDDGSLDVWIAQKPKDIGTKAVELAVALLKGQAVPAINTTDFVIVTKQNLKSPEVRALAREVIVDAPPAQKTNP